MKKKSLITIISVCLNVILFSALAYFNKINSRTEGSPAPFFIHKHLPDMSYLQNDGHEVALASTVK